MKLDVLSRLYGSDAPPGGPGCVSVYLDTTPDETAPAETGLHWRAARERLANEGADDATLEAVADQVSGAPPHSPGVAVFARQATVLLARPLPWRPRDEVSRYAPLPHVTPLLQQLAADAPHVRVSATREGARLLLGPAGDGGQDIQVKGESWPVHKVSRGGWSEYRLQHAAEETWAENAKRIAAATVAAVQRAGAAFVVVGGDERERGLVLSALPEAVRRTAVTVDKEAEPDSPSFDAAAAAEGARLAAAAVQAWLEDFRARISRFDRGGRLRELGVDDGVAVRGDAAVARAVYGTDAELYFLPEGEEPPADGIGALLRAPVTAV
jgi:hypothetical protein